MYYLCLMIGRTQHTHAIPPPGRCLGNRPRMWRNKLNMNFVLHIVWGGQTDVPSKGTKLYDSSGQYSKNVTTKLNQSIFIYRRTLVVLCGVGWRGWKCMRCRRCIGNSENYACVLRLQPLLLVIRNYDVRLSFIALWFAHFVIEHFIL